MARRRAKLLDPLTAQQRALNMSRIRSKNTKPEMVFRRALHGLGLRYALHRKDLPGTPDVVLTRYNVAVFVHGCFWHGHDCPLGVMPRTNEAFWTDKIQKNRSRDARAIAALQEAGWRLLLVWECAFRGVGSQPVAVVATAAERFIRSSKKVFVLRGNA